MFPLGRGKAASKIPSSPACALFAFVSGLSFSAVCLCQALSASLVLISSFSLCTVNAFCMLLALLTLHGAE